MRKAPRRLRKTPLLLLIGLLLISAVQVIRVNAATVQTCNAPALGQCTLTFNLNNGDSVSGSISITGGSGNDVNFYVTNPSGAQVYGAGRVSGGTSFSFTANSAGAYILHFDNSFSLFSSKQVTVSYDVTSSGVGGIPEFPAQLPLAALVAFLVVASYIVIRLKSTSRGGPQSGNLPSRFLPGG